MAVELIVGASQFLFISYNAQRSEQPRPTRSTVAPDHSAGLSGLRAQAYLWSEYAIAFASDSPASSRSVGTPKLSNRSVTWGFSQISMLRQSSSPLASLSRRYAILTVCPK